MLMLRKKVIKFFWAVFFAIGHYLLTVIVFNNVAGRSMIAATVLNFALIMIFLIEERIGDYYIAKQGAKEQSKKQSIFKRIFKSYFNSVSYKTALYLFYIFILICSATDRVEPDLFNENFSRYLLTVEYGILVLVAADTFLNQFDKDVSSR
jgi:hypothetical protein